MIWNENCLAFLAFFMIIYTMHRMFSALKMMSIDDVIAIRNSNITVYWNAPFLSGGGYCSEAMSLVSAIDKRGFDLHAVQHGDGVSQGYIQGLPAADQRFLWSLMTKKVSRKKNTVIEICHSEPGAWKPAAFSTTDCPQFDSSVSYHIGRTMFETDRIPRGWKTKLNSMDEVWVPSEFMKDIFERGGVRNVHVIGESVDTNFFRPIPSVQKGSTLSVREDVSNNMNITRAYLFDEIFERHPIHGYRTDVLLSIFKWEYRKGWDILFETYLRSFKKSDNVSLFIITQEYHEEESIEDQVDKFIEQWFSPSERENLPHFKIVTTYAPKQYLPYLYNMASMIVLPTRGEGWGRVAQEAMSCGSVVITTAYGGAMTFLNEKNSFPISVSEYVKIKEGPFRGHLLVELNRKEFVDAIRGVLKNPEEARVKGEQARKDMVEHYSEDAFGALLEKEFWRIQEIMEKRKEETSDDL